MMSKLQGFVVVSTLLSGALPSEIGQLTELLYLNIGISNLNGTLPTELGALVNLLYFSTFYNRFTGTLPSSLQSMVYLQELNLNNNQFEGSIPSFLGSYPFLSILSLDDNFFEGSLPSELSNAGSLQNFFINGNLLTGIDSLDFNKLVNLKIITNNGNLLSEFPSQLCNVTGLRYLDMSYNAMQSTIPDCLGQLQLFFFADFSSNALTGAIPSFGMLSGLKYLKLEDNLLSGTVGSWLGQLEMIETIQLGKNHLSGSLPASMSSLHELSLLDVSSNSFTGTVPSSMVMLSKLHFLNLGLNSFRGELPLDLGLLSLLQNMRVQDNSLSNTLPSSVVNLKHLEYLDISANFMTGIVPSGVSQLSLLEYLLIQNNRFVGSIGHIINASHQKSIRNLDFSGNLFSGQLPADIFATSQLVSFGAVSNCFSGTLPDAICDAANLEVLAVDGMSVTDECSVEYVASSWFSAGSYGMEHVIEGTVPSCLFEMSKIRVLHLSGVGIDSTLPQSLTVTSSLVDLSLSHNLIEGTIPAAIQQHSWTNLDLSFNRFSGSLRDDFAEVADNATLSLVGNHLSGDLPPSIITAQQVSVLEGNRFACNSRDSSSTLPPQDESFDNYQCGNSLDQIGIYWAMPYIIVVGLILVVGCGSLLSKMVARASGAYVTNVKAWLLCFEDAQQPAAGSEGKKRRTSSLYLFKNFAFDWMYVCSLISILLVVCVMPVWVWLSVHYKTYEQSYAWVTSMAYMSGSLPAFISTAVFVVVLVVCYLLLHKKIHSSNMKRRTSLIGDLKIKVSLKSTASYYLVAFVAMCMNSGVVLTVNVLFVLVSLDYSPTIVTLCTIALTLFDLVWNGLVVPQVMGSIQTRFAAIQGVEAGHVYNRRTTFVLVLIELLNNLIIPFIASAFVTPTCFYHLLFQSPSIESSYDVSVCTLRDTIHFNCREVLGIRSCDIMNSISFDCTGSEDVVINNSFEPPFYYSFQCSTTFLDDYVAVFVYAYLITAFGLPLITYLMMKLRNYCGKGGWVSDATQSQLPAYLHTVTDAYGGDVIFDQVGFVVSVVGDAVVLLTFGVVFPPLSIFICVGVLSRVCYVMCGIGRLLNNVAVNHPDQLPNYKGALLRDCRGVAEIFLHVMYTIVLPFAAVFYSFFVFDMMGYAHGWADAIWLALLLAISPLLFWAIASMYKYFLKRRKQRRRKQSLLVNVADDDDDDEGGDDEDEEADKIDVEQDAQHIQCDSGIEKHDIEKHNIVVSTPLLSSPVKKDEDKEEVEEEEEEKGGMVRETSRVAPLEIAEEDSAVV